jgi:hypothetical protein
VGINKIFSFMGEKGETINNKTWLRERMNYELEYLLSRESKREHNPKQRIQREESKKSNKKSKTEHNPARE